LLAALLDVGLGDIGFEVDFLQGAQPARETVIFCEVDRTHASAADDLLDDVTVP
jgi:hypothetical protein